MTMVRPGSAAVVALVLALAACSDSGDATDPAPPTTPTTTRPAAVTTTTTVPTAVTTTTAVPATGTVPAPLCSAVGKAAEPEPQDLPEPVAATRRDIVAAAVACDFEALAAVVASGAPGLFTYAFGDIGDPAGYWAEQELVGIRSMSFLVETLNLPFAQMDVLDGGDYVWPVAFSYESWQAVPPAEQAVLSTIYEPDDFAAFEDFGAFIGYRTAISARGAWIFFVSGD